MLKAEYTGEDIKVGEGFPEDQSRVVLETPSFKSFLVLVQDGSFHTLLKVVKK